MALPKNLIAKRRQMNVPFSTRVFTRTLEHIVNRHLTDTRTGVFLDQKALKYYHVFFNLAHRFLLGAKPTGDSSKEQDVRYRRVSALLSRFFGYSGNGSAPITDALSDGPGSEVSKGVPNNQDACLML